MGHWAHRTIVLVTVCRLGQPARWIQCISLSSYYQVLLDIEISSVSIQLV